jgi:hypothetical protein
MEEKEWGNELRGSVTDYGTVHTFIKAMEGTSKEIPKNPKNLAFGDLQEMGTHWYLGEELEAESITFVSPNLKQSGSTEYGESPRKYYFAKKDIKDFLEEVPEGFHPKYNIVVLLNAEDDLGEISFEELLILCRNVMTDGGLFIMTPVHYLLSADIVDKISQQSGFEPLFNRGHIVLRKKA